MSRTSPPPTSRRLFVRQTAGLLASAALPPWLASATQMAPGPAANASPAKSRLILLGTGGGPTPKLNRSAPSQVIVVNGQTYVIDAGNGTPRQMALAKLKYSSIRALFITHQHSDHNADYGNLLLLGWGVSTASRPIAKVWSEGKPQPVGQGAKTCRKDGPSVFFVFSTLLRKSGK